jgi:putative addiction module component (TIGR02574 family)
MSEADGRDPPEELEELTADEFAAELNRRAAELEASPEAGIPWDEVKEMR